MEIYVEDTVGTCKLACEEEEEEEEGKYDAAEEWPPVIIVVIFVELECNHRQHDGRILVADQLLLLGLRGREEDVAGRVRGARVVGGA